jgi:glycosyltransferase involved in cell wall biosynthesis
VKNIAFIIELANTKRYGGEQHAMINLANELSKVYSVDIYSYVPKDNQKKINTFYPSKLKTAPFIRDMIVVPFVGRKLFKIIDSQYDIIFVSSTTMAAFYKPKTKLITVCHIVRSQKFKVLSKIPKYRLLFNPFVYKVMSYLELKSLKNSDNIITIRDHQKKYLKKCFKIDATKINVVPNGIDTNIFRPLKVPKKNQVIFVGRGTVPKGLDLLLEAADQIKAKILVVSQNIEPELLQIANSKKNVVIKFNAKPNELVKLYSESKVFVLPSRDEEQPLTVLEAMSCNLPIVVSKKAAADFFKYKNINGKVIDNLNPSAIADACNELLEHNATNKNRLITSKHFSLNRSTMAFNTYL